MKRVKKSDPNVCLAGFLASSVVGAVRVKKAGLFMFVWLVSSLKRGRSENG